MKSRDKITNKNVREMPPSLAASDLVRCALKASLATLDRTTGHPYASLVTLATEPDGTPLMLISRLALHTQNLLQDPRASLLCDGTGADGDPLASGRVTLIGQAERTESTSARRRFLARHPKAALYADFPDFAFYAVRIERAHFIGGFGRIVDIAPPDLLTDLAGAGSLVAAEAEIIAHMNDDHAAAVELYATVLAGVPGGAWLMTGIDPDGCDLVCGGEARRIGFSVKVTTPGLARQELARLAAHARERAPHP